MSLLLITGPTAEPISLDEAKLYLHVDDPDQDALIEANIVAAREYAEDVTNRPLITQTWDLFLDSFATKILLKHELQSVTSVKYIDTDGVTQNLATTEYTVDTNSAPGSIFEAYLKTWPSPRAVKNAVTVRFVAGFGNAADDVPRVIRDGMLFYVDHLFDVGGGASADMHARATQMLLSKRAWTF